MFLLPRTRIALIVDNLRLCRWQAEALGQISAEVEILLLNCTNTRFTRRAGRHGLYYLLNLIALRPPPTQSTEIPDELEIIDRMDFASDWEGAWQRLPPTVLARLDDWQPALAIKFGMGLMRIPPELKCKVLSFHHGDPRKFRGRPAGFYELLQGATKVGQIVQVLSNRLDAGEIVTFAETRARPDSYRATMDESYRTSPLLMRAAFRNCLAGRTLPFEPTGKNYRLPSNLTVLRLAGKLMAAKVRRLFYGAFLYKRWEVGVADISIDAVEHLPQRLAEQRRWTVLPRERRYEFLADPFPHPAGGVLAEALRLNDGQGEIVHLHGNDTRVLCTGAGHFSYPATFEANGEVYLLPEVSEWTGPRAYRLSEGSAEFAFELDIEGAPRVVDATFRHQDGRVYLFGNVVAEPGGVLRLWSAPSLAGRFVEHPQSPVRVSPAGGRMAGALLDFEGRTYRVGQDGSRSYGNGIVLFEVTRLSSDEYEEVEVLDLRFDDVKGPHTLNQRSGQVLFDFYRDRFALLAGPRRAAAYLSKRRSLQLAKSEAAGAGSF